jgi:hypothetical protein
MREPSPKVISVGGWISSTRDGRVEFLDQLLEGGFELWRVVIRKGSDDIDDLAVTLDGAFVVPASLLHHTEAIVAVVFVQEVDQ